MAFQALARLPASPWALGPSVEPRRLAFALLAVWGVRLAADAAERGALDALVLNVRLDALVHLVLDVVAVALLYEARRCRAPTRRRRTCRRWRAASPRRALPMWRCHACTRR